MNGLDTLQARDIAGRGRGNDSMLLHVTPREVAGLHALAQASGKNMTYNPRTGLPEAGWLEDMLPAIAGMAAVALTGGLAAPAVAGAAGGLGGAAAAGATTAAAAGAGGLGSGIMTTLAGSPAITSGLASGAVKYAQTGDPMQALGTGLMTGGMSGMMGGMAEMGAGAVPPVDPSVAAAGAPIGGDIGAAATQSFTGADNAAGLLNEQYLIGAPTGTPAADASSFAQGVGSTQMQGPINAAYGVTPSAPTLPDPSAPTLASTPAAQPGLLDRSMSSVGDRMSNIGKGFEKVATEKGGIDTLMKTGGMKYGAPAAIMGYGMQAGAAEKSKLAGEAKESEAKSAAEYDRLKGKIMGNYAAVGRNDWPGAWNAATGGKVPNSKSFPLESGGFVVPKYAVDAVGRGNTEQGLMALKRKVGAKAIRGKGTGTSDSIPASIDGAEVARVSNGEAYVPKKQVKKAGGAKQFYAMLDAAKRNRKGG